MTSTAQPGAVPGRSPQLVDPERIAREHHAELLAVARRHSAAADDAHDAVQRGLEILLRCQHRVQPETAVPWVTVVVKHEALALTRAHARTRAWSSQVDAEFDADPAAPHGDDLCARIDLRDRARRDLPQLKPHERRALGLLAAGHSYREICAITGWTYTKVNRCVTEGRRALRRLDAAAGHDLTRTAA
jgi:RNA polymerase sigma factor (sigma-70 family)